MAALVVVAIGGLVAFLLSDRGLSYLASHVEGRSGGRISVEAPSGSIAGTMRFRRVTWRSADATLVADDVVVDWKPGALLGRHLLIRGLGARRVELTVKPSTGPTSPPTDLALPIPVDIDRLAIGEFAWQAGPRSGRISGLELGYSGNAERHRIDDLALVSDYGRIRGDLTIGAKAPLAVAGRVALDGAGPIDGAHADVTLDGALARLGIAAKGTYREATLSLAAVATPFAATPFSTASGELTGVDLAAIDPAWPATRARVHLAFAPDGGGIAGTFDLVNEAPGPIDAGRVPFAHVGAHFAFAPPRLLLDDVDATVADGGAARGAGTVTLEGSARGVRFALDVADLDLSRLDTKLAATRLSGRVQGDANAARQTIEGDVRERDTRLAFAADIDEARIAVREFRASRAGGSLAGSATLARNDARDFTVQARLAGLDPSRFAALPGASLDGTVDAKGVLSPQWRVAARVDLAPSSRLEGLAVAGTAKGTIARHRAQDLAIDVALGAAHLTASGAAGAPGDRLALAVDVPHLAELAPLLPASVGHALDGALKASGHVAYGAGAVGGDLAWQARGLRIGNDTVATLDGRAGIAPPRTAQTPLDTRALSLDVHATAVVVAGRTFATAQASADGTLAHHRATLALQGEGADAALAVDAALRNAADPAHAAWSGTIASFENRGNVPLRIAPGATFAVRARYAHIANATLAIADGTASVGEFTWDDGRITTRGSFTGVPLATAARLAGRALPLDSTLIVGGRFAIAAAPALNGTFSIARERGDLFADVPAAGATRREAIGMRELTLSGTLRNDALEARATFASARAGTLSATAAIGAMPGAREGRIEPGAPLRLAVQGDLPSLAVFQPWFGTDVAIDGRARLDVAASGTVGAPLWTGAVSGDALRVDAAPFGIHVGGGVLRAHLARNGVALDTLRFTAGEGTLDASGVIALPGAKGAATRVTWKAERFRIANRPDLRFVVDGSGAVALEETRLTLSGNVSVIEGHVEYEPSPSGRLASDIVVEGRPRDEATASTAQAPLALDVSVDLGDRLTFVGEGLDARLAGRIRVTTDANGHLRARGTIRAVNGTYVAFGQKLTIDRGRVIFDGPLDNPALDVVALRKNLPVEAGVEITGTAKVPLVRVTSNPPVPENEALAWLVTGQGLNSTGRIDYGALSAASAALLGRHGKPITTRIAQSIGLDEISLQAANTPAASGTQSTVNQVVVLGKRINDRLSLGYEQGLSLATSAVRLEYALSRQVTIRAEAGTTNGISIVYRRTFR